MAEPTTIQSAAQFRTLLSSSTIVVTDFYVERNPACQQIDPVYRELSTRLSRPKQITFTKVDVEKQRDIAQTYDITSMPTFMIFKSGQVVSKIVGADKGKLSQAIQRLAEEAKSNGSSSTGGFRDVASSSSDRPMWFGADLPKGYVDVTNEVDIKGLDLLNVDSALGSARVLFDASQPSGKPTAESFKGKEKASDNAPAEPDWIESDTDEQMMLFMPFQSSLKIHSLHLTSLPPTPSGENNDDDDDKTDTPLRPKTVNVYSNRAHVLGFEEAEDIPATQTISLSPTDWDPATGTAKIELRFVKFQNVTSLVLFVVDGEGEGDRVRLDRIRIIGEAGRKREMGRLEKIGDEPGE